jgi:hypothetical protein
MKRKRQYIFSKVPAVAVLLLYLPFILVQGFFNYYSPLQQRTQPENIHFQKAFRTLHCASIQPEKNAGNTKSTVRLNKRFQPATISFCVPVSFEVPAYITPETSFGNYLNPALASFHLLTHTLRGPPAVA